MEHETITACENICRDFSWLRFLQDWSPVFANAAVIFGVFVAYNQLTVWRSEHLAKRKAEVAEKLLSSALNVKLAISAVRSAMENVPAGVGNTQDAVLEIKLKRLDSYKPDFDRLRELQVLHEALSGNDDVKNAVDEIFDARQEVYAALPTLHGWRMDENPREEHAQLRRQLEQKIYAMGGQYDEVGPKIVAATEVLRTHLLPEIRMERKRK